MLISGRMLALIQAGQATSAEFVRLHGLYMATATVEAVFLLLVAFALPALMRAPGKETARESSPA